MGRWLRGACALAIFTSTIALGAAPARADHPCPIQACLQGRVVDGNGAGVAGVQVRLWQKSAGGVTSPGFTTTDAAGNINAGDVPPGTWRVSYDPPSATGLAREWYPNRLSFGAADDVVLSAGSTTHLSTITLEPAATISGVVTGPGGAPASGVTVELSEVDPSGALQSHADERITDASGNYTFSQVHPSGSSSYRLGFVPPNGSPLAPEFWNDVTSGSVVDGTPINLASGQSLTANAALSGQASVSGVVTGPTGTPLAGVRVTAYRVEPASAQIYAFKSFDDTDASGTYSLPALPDGNYRLAVDLLGGHPSLANYWIDTTIVGGATTRNITVPNGATVHVELDVDADAPLPPDLQLWPVGDYDWFFSRGAFWTTTPTASGFDVTQLPAGTFTVSAAGFYFVGEYHGGSQTEGGSVPITVPSGGTVGPITMSPDVYRAQHVSAVAGDGHAVVSWERPSVIADPHLVQMPVEGWQIEVSPSTGVTGPTTRTIVRTPPLTGPEPPTSFDFTGLTNGIDYTFTIRALNAAWLFFGLPGPSSAPSNVVTPGNAPSIAIGDASVVEGDSGVRTLVFPVVLSEPSSTPVTVQYRVVPGSASAPSDVNDLKGKVKTLTFKPATSTGLTPAVKYISVKVNGDTAVEGDETVNVELSSPSSGYVLANGMGEGTILDDDPGSGTRIGIGDAIAYERNPGTTVKIKVPLTLSAPSAGTVTVTYDLVGVTAVANADYVPLKKPKTVTFKPGQWKKSITIKVAADLVAEGTESLQIVLSNPSGATLERPFGTVTIVDDD